MHGMHTLVSLLQQLQLHKCDTICQWATNVMNGCERRAQGDASQCVLPSVLRGHRLWRKFSMQVLNYR